MKNSEQPQIPDNAFALRYRQTSRYAFYMRYDSDGDGHKQERISDVPDDRFVVLEVNPQQVSMREPFATAISFTQGGGKVRESRGGLVKPVTISGTTGYTPLKQGASLHSGTAFPGNAAPARGSLVPRNEDVDKTLSQRSGFLAFHKLRYLFRTYAYELRNGGTNFSLHYIDTKNDEYWRIEPQDFSMTRSSRKPFSYDYSIAFQVVERSIVRVNFDETAPDLSSGVFQPLSSTGWRDSIKRLYEMIVSGQNFLKHLSGTAVRQFQRLLRYANGVTSFFENFHDVFTTVMNTPLVLLAQLDNSLAGVATVADYLNADVTAARNAANAAWTHSMQDNLSLELNEWVLEAQRLSDFLKASWNATKRAVNFDIVRENQKFSVGQVKQGVTTALMQPSPGDAGSPDTNPFMLTSGLSLVTNINQLATTTAVRMVGVYTGDTIFSLAQRTLGDVNRFIDLVLLNNLTFPYIVANTVSKPEGTIAWGEYIQVPDTATGSQGSLASPPAQAPSTRSTVTATGTSTELIDTSFTVNGMPGWITNQWCGYTITLTHLGVDYTRIIVSNTADTLTINIPWTLSPSVLDAYTLHLIQFEAHRPVTPDVETFGSDILLKFTPALGGTASSTLADIVVGSRDIAVIRGLSNFIQAVNIRLRVEQGRLPLHPDFGVLMPVGRPLDPNIGLLYQTGVRESMLQDPRIATVSNMQLSAERDQVTFSADVQPVKVKNFQAVSVTVP